MGGAQSSLAEPVEPSWRTIQVNAMMFAFEFE